jgi:hypothetical protein
MNTIIITSQTASIPLVPAILYLTELKGVSVDQFKKKPLRVQKG